VPTEDSELFKDLSSEGLVDSVAGGCSKNSPLRTELLRRLKESKKPRLVFLCYGDDQTGGVESLKIATEAPEGVEISSDGRRAILKEGVVFYIGTYAYVRAPGQRKGLIGVYDANNPEHLKNMLKHAEEAVSTASFEGA
jgi:hypothetical protein